MTTRTWVVVHSPLTAGTSRCWLGGSGSKTARGMSRTVVRALLRAVAQETLMWAREHGCPRQENIPRC